MLQLVEIETGGDASFWSHEYQSPKNFSALLSLPPPQPTKIRCRLRRVRQLSKSSDFLSSHR